MSDKLSRNIPEREGMRGTAKSDLTSFTRSPRIPSPGEPSIREKLLREGYTESVDEQGNVVLRSPEIEYRHYWDRDYRSRFSEPDHPYHNMYFKSYSEHEVVVDSEGRIIKEIDYGVHTEEYSSTGGWKIKTIKPDSIKTYDYELGTLTTETPDNRVVTFAQIESGRPKESTTAESENRFVEQVTSSTKTTMPGGDKLLVRTLAYPTYPEVYAEVSQHQQERYESYLQQFTPEGQVIVKSLKPEQKLALIDAKAIEEINKTSMPEVWKSYKEGYEPEKIKPDTYGGLSINADVNKDNVFDVTSTFKELSSQYEFKALKAGEGIERAKLSTIAFGAGIIAGASEPFFHPVRFVKGLFGFGKGMVTDPFGTGYGITQALLTEPAKTAGEFTGQYLTFKYIVDPYIIKPAVKYFPIKKKVVNIQTSQENIPVSDLKVKPLGTAEVISPEITILEKGLPKKITTFGLDVGTRSQPIVTLADGKVYFGTPKFETKIPVSSLSSSTPMPESALAGKVFVNALDYTPEEMTRVESVVEAGRVLGSDKGLTVKEAFFNVEGLKNPEVASRIVESFIKQNKGVVFGSSTTLQLPEGYRTLKPGDIDVIFPELSVEQISKRLPKLAESLKKSGEPIRVSTENVLEFESGEKFLEAKSGVNQEILGLGDEAPAGFLGFRFADLKAGQIGKTVPFGEIRAITAGEQFLRKGAGSLITSPGKLPGETPSFSEPGILGKQGNPRGLKDVAGFIQSGKGLVEIRSESFNPITRFRGEVARSALERFYESFSPEQRIDIASKIESITGNKQVLSFSESELSSAFEGSLPETVRPSQITVIGDSVRSKPVSPSIKVSDFSSPPLKVSESIISPESLSIDIYSSVNSLSSLSKNVPSRSDYSSEKPLLSSSSVSVSEINKLSISLSGSISPSPIIVSSPSAFRSPYDSVSPSSSKVFSPSPSAFRSPSPSMVNFDEFSIVRQPPKRRFDYDNDKGDEVSSFDVFVRESSPKGESEVEEVKVNKSPLPRNRALNLGDDYVDNTSARTFRLVPAGTTEEADDPGFLDAYKYRRKQSTNPKIKIESFIEQNQFLIDSPGEHQEITVKGWKAMRNKQARSGGL